MSAPNNDPLPVRGDGYEPPPSNRRDYVKCILTPYGKPEDRKHSICGYYLGGIFAFESIDHAFCEYNNGGRLVACPQCLRVVREALAP